MVVNIDVEGVVVEDDSFVAAVLVAAIVVASDLTVELKDFEGNGDYHQKAIEDQADADICHVEQGLGSVRTACG